MLVESDSLAQSAFKDLGVQAKLSIRWMRSTDKLGEPADNVTGPQGGSVAD